MRNWKITCNYCDFSFIVEARNLWKAHELGKKKHNKTNHKQLAENELYLNVMGY